MKLSEVAWVELAEHPEQGPIGRIVKWSEDQYVQHPKPSKLKAYFHLTKASGRPSETVEQEIGNRQQGSKTPKKQRHSKPENTRAGTSKDLTAMEYAKVFLGDVGLPFENNWKVAVGAIEAIAAAHRSSHADAFEYLREEALDAVARGDSVDHLWLLNGRYWPSNRT